MNTAHPVLDSHPRPYRREGLGGRLLPFLVPIVAGVSLAIFHPVDLASVPFQLSVALVIVLAILTVVLPWDRWPGPAQASIPLAGLPILALIRDASGAADSELSVAALLVVFWLALYGGRTELIMSLVGLSAMFVVPVLLFGSPRYPARGLVFGAFMVSIGGVIGYSIQKLLGEIRRSESKFRTLADGAPVGIFVADAHGGITYVNREWQKLLGMSAEQALGDGWQRGIDPDDVPRLAREWAEASATGSSYRGKCRTSGLDGTVRWLAFSSVAVPSVHDVPAGYTGTVSDISSLVAAQENLASARDEAILASQMKSAFLANMSHEIRTPMNGVLGMAGLLLDEPDLTEQQRRYAQAVRSSAESLMEIIDDLLDFSKVEAGKLRLQDHDFSIREVVREAADILAPTAARKAIDLRIVDRHDRDWVRGDPGRLRQVLLNLAENAVKFSHEGRVEIRIDDQPGDGGAELSRFEVADTGIGIAEKDQAKLFQAFHQVDASPARNYGGTGLGLAISRQLVELMGGEIGVESRLGFGSTFWFTVALGPAKSPPAPPAQEPATVKTTASAAAPPEEPTPIRPGRVLVAEDNQVNQMVAVGMLRKLGYITDVVANGADAVEAVSKSEYLAVMMDLHMPEMDGYEAAREIRRRFADRQMPIIAMSASVLKSDRQACFDAGMDDYLAKPVQVSELDEVLKRWVAAVT